MKIVEDGMEIVINDRDRRILSFWRLQSNIQAIDEPMVDRLVGMGYFDAPASKNHHGNAPGMLFEHHNEVRIQLLHITESLGLRWGHPRSPYVVSMFHDLCKCDQYVMNPDGNIDYNQNMLLSGHGDKSCILAASILPDITEEELLCIRWHMGAFDDSKNWNCYTAAVKKYPNVLYTHMADMIASQIVGI